MKEGLHFRNWSLVLQLLLVLISPKHTLGTRTFMQWNTGKTWSEGRTVRAPSADCRVLAGIWTAGRTGSGTSPSDDGIRVWYFLNKKERQTHWSWIYCVTTFPHPWEAAESSEKLKQNRHSSSLAPWSQAQSSVHGIMILTRKKVTVALKDPVPQKARRPTISTS